jgi:beta-glucanase (GH16 family)
MKKCLFFLLTLLAVDAPAQLLFKLTADTLRTFVYSSGDEFNDSNVRTDYWRGPWNRINMAQNFRYNDANVKLNNGTAQFLMLQQDSVYPILGQAIDSAFLKETKISIANDSFAVNYSAGMLITRQKFHYGIYELKFKVEEGKGLWPAFWFYGGNKNEEIDVFELKGEKNNAVHVDAHCPSGCDHGYKNKIGIGTGFGGWTNLDKFLHVGYNIMALDWRKNELVWLVNGYPLAYFKGDFANPMNLFLNTQIAANGRVFGPGPDQNTKFPNIFFADYLRIWQTPASGSNPILQKSKILSAIDTAQTSYVVRPRVKRGLMYSKKKFNAEQGSVALFLAANGKLNAQVFGNLRGNSEIYLLGKVKKYVLDTRFVESTHTLDNGEKNLELVIKTKGKEYRTTFEIVE